MSAIRARQGDRPAAEDVHELMKLAAAHLESGRVRLILVGGLPGTGKSTLAAGLGGDLHAVVLRSDAIRKELAGLVESESAAAPFEKGIYSSAHTARTYDAMLERARDRPHHGRERGARCVVGR